MSKPRQIAQAYLVSVSIWCALSILTGWQYRIFDQSLNIQSSLVDMLRLAGARGFAFALLTPPIFYIVRQYITSARHRVRYLLAYCVGVVPFMVIYAWIRWLILPPWSAALQQYVPRAGHSPWAPIRGGFADLITIYIAIVVAAHAYVYFERVRKQEVERLESQQALAASELQALKMQIHPHFLFNTLHGISTLIDSDRKTAKSMVVKLSSLLRMALEHGSSDLIPLREELKFVGEYLDLEKMRFGPRLTVRWSIAPATTGLLVPQLILQPLVENAIRHGIACSRVNGWVEIDSSVSNEQFVLRVRNSVGGKPAAGTGLGLRNTEARVQYLYSDEGRFSFAIAPNQTATATLTLPMLGSHQEFSALENGRVAGD